VTPVAATSDARRAPIKKNGGTSPRPKGSGVSARGGAQRPAGQGGRRPR
jgi:hypothetical protein